MRNGRTQINYIENFVRRWPKKTLSDISHMDIQRWRKEMQAEGKKPAGINRPISALKAMLNRAVEYGVIGKNPLADVKPLKEDKRPRTRFLYEAEELRLREAMAFRQDLQREQRRNHNRGLSARRSLPDLDCVTYTDHVMPIVLLALNTGLRRGELFNLQVDDIDTKSRRLTVKGATSKSGDSRIIPLNDEAAILLETWFREQAPTDYVFVSPVTGERLDNIKKAWTALLKDADITGFTFHDIRHYSE